MSLFQEKNMIRVVLFGFYVFVAANTNASDFSRKEKENFRFLKKSNGKLEVDENGDLVFEGHTLVEQEEIKDRQGKKIKKNFYSKSFLADRVLLVRNFAEKDFIS